MPSSEHCIGAGAGDGSRVRTIMAFDFGTRRIGIAVGNTLARLATPLATIPAEDSLRNVQPHVAAWQPDLFVIGEPQYADGTPHPTARAARAFARQLEARFARPCAMLDERLSSHAAEARLGESGRATRRLGVDAMAAAVILESYFGALDAANA